MSPMDRSRYPDDWEAISRRIRFDRAGGRCEGTLSDGSRCGARHHATIRRLIANPEKWEETDPQTANAEAGHRWTGPTRVVLTTAHLGTAHADGRPGDKHDRMDCRDENLAALCQRCHLVFDLPDHLDSARRTRDRRRGAIDLIDQVEECDP